MHAVTTILKKKVCSFIVTLSAFDVRPTCDTADVHTILPFPPNPLKHVLCAAPNCCVDVLSAILVVSLEVVGGDVYIVLDERPQEEITRCQVW